MSTKEEVQTTGESGALIDNIPEDDADIGSRLRKKPTMTAIGKAHLITTLKGQIRSVSKRLDHQISILTPLLQSASATTIENETLNLDRIHSEITDTHARLCETLCGDEDNDEFKAATDVIEAIDSQYFSMKTKLCEWQLEWEAQLSKKGSSAGSTSSSRASSKRSKGSRASSKDSNCSNKSLKLRAKIAGLRAEAEAIVKTNEAELNARLLKNEQEIAKMEAMEKVYAESTCSRKIHRSDNIPGDDADVKAIHCTGAEPSTPSSQKREQLSSSQEKESVAFHGNETVQPPSKKAKHSAGAEPAGQLCPAATEQQTAVADQNSAAALAQQQPPSKKAKHSAGAEPAGHLAATPQLPSAIAYQPVYAAPQHPVAISQTVRTLHQHQPAAAHEQHSVAVPKQHVGSPAQLHPVAAKQHLPQQVIAQHSLTQQNPAPQGLAPDHLSSAVVEMVKLQTAPKPDLDVFAGDPLEYPYFKASFKEVVEVVVTEQRGRLTRLIKYTSGDAKDLIKHLVHSDPNDCYDRAVAMLDKEYGNPHLIHQSYIKELRQWEPIKPNDTAGYKRLYRFLLKCHTYKESYRLKELDSTEMIRTIICKIHQSLQERWNRKAISIRTNQSREADFSDLLKFVEYEVTLMCDPAYSKDALSDSNKLLKSNFTSTINISDADKCPMCSSNHDIERCDEFTNLDIDDRHKMVFQKKLCFGCLKPVGDNHNGKNCDRKRKCLVCKESHPTTLHGGKNVTSNFSNMQCSVISMCVVQVELWHDGNPNNVVKTYALLDECSTGSFITDEVLDKLQVVNAEHTSVDVATIIGNQQQHSRRIDEHKLVVRAIPSHSAIYGDSPIKLPVTYSRPFLAVDPEEIPTPSRIQPWAHLKDLVAKIPDYDPAVPVGLMLGGDCPQANEVVEVMPSANDGPYGKRTRLGWCVIGPIARCPASKFVHSNYTSLRGNIPVKDVISGNVASHSFFTNDPPEDPYKGMLNRMYQEDFNEVNGEKEGLSVEDRRFLQIMKDGVSKVNNHYQLPLPIRNIDLRLPNNRFQASKRLTSLKRRMAADPEFSASYNNIIQGMLSSGYARRAEPSKDRQGEVWYVPHFGVFNPKKGKLRVVFDFAAKFKGRCLNSELIPGPNLINLMIGVIIRFRKEQIAYMADIEAMYHQVIVPEGQRSLLRFLFWPDGDLSAEPIDMEMCVHPFGAVSSGSCSNYALRQTAADNESEIGSGAATTLRRDFYIDDNLKSMETVAKALAMFNATRKMCAAGGFKLTKFVSNSPELTEAVPSECRASPLIDLSMSKQQLPLERALGVFWCIENDTLQFRITLQNKPMTRRGVLATIGSIHDPTGVAGPFLLPGRKVLQAITKLKGEWDDDLPSDLRSEWEKWRAEIPKLESIKVNRCYKPPGFNSASASLHSFSDASDYGYGMVTYLRQVSHEGEVCVSLVMAKSRVVPAKQTTIPRMELTAAVVSAQVTTLVEDELDMELNPTSYWVDSTITLGYIQNETKRARTYVANRQQKILSLTNKDSWGHVDTKENPADYASRGLMVSEIEKVAIWLNGPKMLWEKGDPSTKPRFQAEIPDDDPEIQVTVSCNKTSVLNNTTLSSLENNDSWTEVKETVATAVVFIQIIRKQRESPEITAIDLEAAEKRIISMLQSKYFHQEKKCLKSNERLPKSSTIMKLDPFLDKEELLRVGGRLRRGPLLNHEKHPVILPKKEAIVTLIIQHYHEEIAHLGRTSTLGELRIRGYWIISGGSQVRKLVDHCQHCRGLRGKPENQKMADLPEDRVSTMEPPFTRCGADMFGPFIIRERRSELKRYGIVFTCYSCRGVHIEATTKMDTDSFILALRRFLSRRGPVRSIRSDNGGNFVGVEEEMKKALQEMDHVRIRKFLLKHACDWIEWQKNPPEASHMGGVWERQIRTIRSALSSLLLEHAGKLDDESFRTLLSEVEAIVNSRPLCTDNLNDENEGPLTPNHLLTMKSKVLLPPPGVFQRADVYCRKRWRAVQHLANEFWQRFKKEHLQTLQSRQKWHLIRRNVAVGDIVLVVEKDLPRNRWSKGRVTKVFPGEDGLVRQVDVKIAGTGTILRRPISKLVNLIQADEP